MRTPGNSDILTNAHSVVYAGLSASGLVFAPSHRGLPGQGLRELFGRMVKATIAPAVDQALLAMWAEGSQALLRAGFRPIGEARTRSTRGPLIIIREAACLLVDPALPREAAPPVSVSLRLIARADKGFTAGAPNLSLDIVARRPPATPDEQPSRPFIFCPIGETRIEWADIFSCVSDDMSASGYQKTVSDCIEAAIKHLRTIGQSSGSFEKAADTFATRLVDVMAP